MKLVILETFKWSLLGLLKATKLVIKRSSFCNFSMNTKPGHTADPPKISSTTLTEGVDIAYWTNSIGRVASGRVCAAGLLRLVMKVSKSRSKYKSNLTIPLSEGVRL